VIIFVERGQCARHVFDSLAKTGMTGVGIERGE